jgi:hypothetical protein
MAAQTAMKRLLFLLLIAPRLLAAETGAYRVELLVFSHAENAANPVEVEALRSFAAAFPLDGELLPGDPDDPAPLGVMSDMMQGVWRRLESSPAYRPLLFRVWEQSRVDYHPPVRVQDGEVVEERLEFPGGIAFLDLRDPDMLEPYVDRLYRLDGTAQLRRSRFLHLDLDLEYRAEWDIPDRSPPASGTGLTALRPDPTVSGDVGVPARLYGLQQTRQIRTGQLQYFDTPYLGVLARVTATAGE